MRVGEIWQEVLADKERYVQHGEMRNGGGDIVLIIKLLLCRNHRFAFSAWRRLAVCEDSRFIRLLAKFYYRRLSRMYGLQIPPSTKIGGGLYIGHGIGIVVNGKTIIGKNCNISQFLTIGSNKGTPATIGDNVYIGPHVCIVEDVKIGNNAKIGAGTVVIHDIPEGATSVGNPNRIILKS